MAALPALDTILAALDRLKKRFRHIGGMFQLNDTTGVSYGGKTDSARVRYRQDLHGGDYTKAAVRAVEDAIHHSSLTLIRTLGIDPATMQVEVMIGIQHPEKVDASAVKAALPHGQVTVRLAKGGLDVPEEGTSDITVIASAAITVRLDLASAASAPR